MRLRLPLKDLQAATAVVAAVATKANTPMPALGNILFIAEKGVVRLEGTDIETQVVATVPGVIEEEGRTTIEAGRLSQLVKLFPAGSDVLLEAKGSKAQITCETNEYKLLTMPVEDFPDWMREPATTRLRIEQKVLRNMLAAVDYAVASGKDGRRVLFGIHVELRDNQLRMTATDGKKLARISVSVGEVDGAGTASITLPIKPAGELRRVLGDSGPIDIELSARQISFTMDNITIRTQAIDGKYPDCDAVIPKEFAFEAGFDRDRILSAVRRAGIVANDSNRSIILQFEPGNCVFKSMAYDVGSFSGKAPIEYTGDQIRVGFNCDYLTETLGCFPDPNLKVHLKNSNAPVIFRSAKEPDRLALLMPIKLSSVATEVGEAADEASGDE
ncbi:MAG: DNA polymerase III subunit beta [Candidatus Sumerlaeia bacterium]|nr:DNA polymerase III subunit beta [Candidatus Sumerlaeia bacterium]